MLVYYILSHIIIVLNFDLRVAVIFVHVGGRLNSLLSFSPLFFSLCNFFFGGGRGFTKEIIGTMN